MVSQIKALCKKHNTNLKSLERTLGFGNGTIRRWDESSPALEKVKAVAQYFGVSVSDLTGEEQQKKPTTVSGDGLSEKDQRLIEWFRSLPQETRQAILHLGAAPEDLHE